MNRGTQRGIALVTTLLIVAMAATIATFMAQQQGFWQREMENGRDRAQARRIAEAGIDWARAVLADDAVLNQYDHAGEMWAIQLAAIPIDRGEVIGHIADQQGLFNLNSLVRNGVASQADVANFQRLLVALELPQELASALADWMDADTEAMQDGAEDEYYLALPKPYRCSNRPLSDIGELVWVRGFDKRARSRLQPYVSVLPESNTAVNVNFAPAEVLYAMLPGLSLQEARQIVARIKNAPVDNMQDFLRQLPDNVPRSSNLGIKSNYFLVTGHATQGNGASSVHALLHRNSIWAKQVRKNLQ